MKIAQFGTFDIENYGDLLFPLLVKRRLAPLGDHFLEAVSPVGGPSVWEGGVSSLSTMEFVAQAGSFDAVMIGGGNIIRPAPSLVGSYAAAPDGVAHYADLWLGASFAAKPQAPVIWLSPGVPGAFHPSLHDTIRLCLERADSLSVRDEISKKFLLEVWPEAPVSVVPDMAWEIDKVWSSTELDNAYAALFERMGIKQPRRTVVFHLNKRYLIQQTAQTVGEKLDLIANKLDATPILLAIGPCHGDSELARIVAPTMRSAPILIDRPQSLLEVAACLRGAVAYVGSAMHGYITASAFGVPSLCVASLNTLKFKGITHHLPMDYTVVETWQGAADCVQEILTEKHAQQAATAKTQMLLSLDAYWQTVTKLLGQAHTNRASFETENPAMTVLQTRIKALSATYAQNQQEREALRDQIQQKKSQEVPTEIKNVADHHATNAVLQARIETLSSSLNQAQQNLERLRQMEQFNHKLSAELRSIHASLSWTVTKPLRFVARRMPGLANMVLALGRKARRKLRLFPLARRVWQIIRRTKIPTWSPETDFSAKIKAYRNRDLSHPRDIVVYTAIAGGYDRLFLPENPDAGIDYVCFTDDPTESYGVWQIRAMPYYHPDPTRMARYVKTHPVSLFPNHKIAIWVDSNIIIRGDVRKYIDVVKNGNHDVGFIPHPLRDCVYEEAEACIERSKDAPAEITRQIDRYREMGIKPHQGMMETNFFVARLDKPGTTSFFRHWWSELDQFSRRDQLSIGYAFGQSNVDWVHLMPQGTCCRNSTDFALYAHAQTKLIEMPKELKRFSRIDNPLAGRRFAEVREERLKTVRGMSADIIVCVYNALEDVKLCLDSAHRHLEPGHRIIIVNDKSNEETTQYLREFAASHDRTTLIENEINLGYTKSANVGLAAGTSDFRIMLNSDTIVPKNWLLKLMELAYSSETIGIVGPMSTAASYQSLPHTKSTVNQTAINELPEGVSVDEVDLCCEQWALADTRVMVPLVHGFCFGIKGSVMKAISLFDDMNFERFYGEENDYCFRARKAGFELAVATNTFVFHRKSRSISEEERVMWMSKMNNRLREIHGRDQIRLACTQMADNHLFELMRKEAGKKWDKSLKNEALKNPSSDETPIKKAS